MSGMRLPSEASRSRRDDAGRRTCRDWGGQGARDRSAAPLRGTARVRSGTRLQAHVGCMSVSGPLRLLAAVLVETCTDDRAEYYYATLDQVTANRLREVAKRNGEVIGMWIKPVSGCVALYVEKHRKDAVDSAYREIEHNRSTTDPFGQFLKDFETGLNRIGKTHHD